jgi:hypothetical protein
LALQILGVDDIIEKEDGLEKSHPLTLTTLDHI